MKALSKICLILGGLLCFFSSMYAAYYTPSPYRTTYGGSVYNIAVDLLELFKQDPIGRVLVLAGVILLTAGMILYAAGRRGK